jgi:hypothetical protein
LSLGTAAGTTIRNTATASYEDDDGNDFETESNEVEVTVSKVAGITNVPTAFNNLGDLGNGGAGAGGTILTGQTVEAIFTVTNTGNDISDIVIPEVDDITTTGVGTVTLEFSTDGGATFNLVSVGGETIPDVPVDGEILVRATGVVTATAAGAPISFQLGNTGSNSDPNAPLPDTQNQPDAGLQDDNVTNDAGGEDDDVRTETASGDDPANGQREAAALAQQFLGSNPLALARIEKTNDGSLTDPNPNPAGGDDLADNLITYNLELEVVTVSPDPAFTPADLEGRDYTGQITGVADVTNLILVSDAIPANTELNAQPTPPTDWTVIYTDDDPATIDANDADWDTALPAGGLSAVTRIGWVYDARAVGGQGAIAQGDTVTGFTFTVETTGVTDAAFPSGTTIANIAQVYGSTDDGDDNTTDGTPIFDESGDQDPSNFDGNTPGPDEDDPESDGVADPANHGTDPNDDNQGDGSPGGEDNVVSVIPAGALLNGPGGLPDASGDIFQPGTPDNDHDFQNLATLPAGTDPTPDLGTEVDPDPVVFDNTLSNPDPTNPLDDVLLQPIQPSFAGGDDGDLPDGTTVRIDIIVNGAPTFAEYTYVDVDPDDAIPGIFNITDGTPILIPTIDPGVELDYTVTVDLPNDTPLSTDQVDPADVNNTELIGGFPVPLIAFVDGDNDGTPDPGETSNITVDQVYTGFLRLVKQSRILQGDGPTVDAPNDDFSVDAKPAAPGNIIEYRVVYRNISETQSGSGTNLILNAQNVVITEDGTTGDATTANNWALDLSPADGILDTVNVQNSAATTSAGATINFATGAPAVFGGTIDPGETTTGYRLTVTTVAPTGAAALSEFNVPGDTVPTGFESFTFQRTVSDGQP